jgi:type 1 glutamine amidotransferase/nicotinamidase-related amidase
MAADAASPLRVCMVSGSFEYDSDTALEGFKAYLESRCTVDVHLLKATGWEHIPGLEALETCDVALFYTRRLQLSGAELEAIQRYCRSGKPVVGVRTASHGFQTWLEMDREIYGGNYQAHNSNGPTTEVSVTAAGKGHPILRGVGHLRSRYSLYRNAPIAEDCTVLLEGSTPFSEGSQPVAWTRELNGARIFYTSLGGMSDFEGASFQRMLANALFWAAGRDPVWKPLPPLEPPTRVLGDFSVPVRSRGKVEEEGERSEILHLRLAETAIIVCDMWDMHWCPSAAERVERLAEKMDPVLDVARKAGLLIVHAPSDTMDFYAETPARRRAQDAPRHAPPTELPFEDPPLPIDDSDGGCAEEAPQYVAWTRQHAALRIMDSDVVSDDGREIYGVFAERGIRNVILMGVHVNMCVLNRSFGIKQLARWGFRVLLARDLTDAMYSADDPPYVDHDEGTERVVQHIERHWCPSLRSEDLVGALE